VGAHDLPSRGFDDQLAEAVGMAIRDRPRQIVIPGHSDGGVVPGAGLLFGEPDTGVLGVGEAADRHHPHAGREWLEPLDAGARHDCQGRLEG
jgi:hypothetical protein